MKGLRGPRTPAGNLQLLHVPCSPCPRSSHETPPVIQNVSGIRRNHDLCRYMSTLPTADSTTSIISGRVWRRGVGGRLIAEVRGGRELIRVITYILFKVTVTCGRREVAGNVVGFPVLGQVHSSASKV
ncbi:hypothetical protein E2C01_082701 [Portunus trituberculatus]|uniref:Uncharacterized protein n=1 Tax=Portunus trituberculatus TaxID=210409 RepID=A0A5B7J5U9_PORTR|nr:hypothetical protein [Portunus trituberculatus]